MFNLQLLLHFMKTKLLFSLLGLMLASSAYSQPAFTPFNPVSVCGETVVYFVCQNSDQYHTITWYFGDDTKAYGKSVAHQYRTPGTYTVKLVVSKNGILDSMVKQDFILIRPVPLSKFIMDESSEIHTGRKFINQSISNDSGIKGFAWAVDSKVVSDNQDFTYRFNKSGIYQVSLNVVNYSGCTAVSNKTFEVHDNEVLPLGIIEKNTSNLKIFPNPAANVLYIQLPEIADLQYRILDVHGKEVLKGAGSEINIEELPDGPYLVLMQSEKLTWSSRFNKSKM